MWGKEGKRAIRGTVDAVDRLVRAAPPPKTAKDKVALANGRPNRQEGQEEGHGGVRTEENDGAEESCSAEEAALNKLFNI